MAGLVGIQNALLTHDEAARGEVGAGQGGEQVSVVRLGCRS